MRWGVILTVFLATLLLANTAHALACTQMTPYGPLADGDCDGFPDAHDNCPAAVNADQMDSNRNGVGDACDLLLDEVIVQPDTTVAQGEYARLSIRMVNGRDEEMRDVTVRVESTSLSYSAREQLVALPSREAATLDFWIRVPKCAKVKEHDITISIASTDLRGVRGTEVQRVPLRVVDGGACGTPDGPLDTTIINVFGKVDVDRGDTVVVPIRIQNLGPKQAEYALAVQGTQGWTVWRLEPSGTLTLASGQDATGYLFLETPEGISPGTRTVTLSIGSGSQRTSVPIQVYVRAPLSVESMSWNTAIQGILIGIIIILIALAIVLAFRHGRRGEHRTVAVEKVERRKKESNY